MGLGFLFSFFFFDCFVVFYKLRTRLLCEPNTPCKFVWPMGLVQYGIGALVRYGMGLIGYVNCYFYCFVRLRHISQLQ